MEPARTHAQEGPARGGIGGLTFAQLKAVAAQVNFKGAASIRLPNGTIRPASIAEWGKWKAHKENYTLRSDEVRNARVSTVFLGLPLFQTAETREMQFETMVFGGLFDEVHYRYKDEATAIDGHERILRAVKDADDELTRLMREAEDAAGL